jgi:hypothetical protein
MNVKKRITLRLNKVIVAILLVAMAMPSVVGMGHGLPEDHSLYAKIKYVTCKFISFNVNKSLAWQLLQMNCDKNRAPLTVESTVKSSGYVTEFYNRPDITPTESPQQSANTNQSIDKDLSKEQHQPVSDENIPSPIAVQFPPTSRLIAHLWDSSIIASIAHAMMTPHFPNLAQEHGWDESNYLIQDSSGSRGTISFRGNQVVGAFRNDNEPSRPIAFNRFFESAPADIRHIAEQETLPYLLEDTDGIVRPSFTAAFWVSNDVIYLSDTWDVLVKYGAKLFIDRIMDVEKAYTYWKDVYKMNDAQFELFKRLSHRKITHPQVSIVLTHADIEAIGTPENPNGNGMDLSKASFQEIGIHFP